MSLLSKIIEFFKEKCKEIQTKNLLCINCTHHRKFKPSFVTSTYSEDIVQHRCVRNGEFKYSPVTGESTRLDGLVCQNERLTSHDAAEVCGEDAVYFKPSKTI